VPAAFAIAYARLFAYTRERGPWKDVEDLFLEHTYIHCGRELVLEAALKQGFSHLLWLDTDMTFPRTSAVQLAAHNQPIVGCNYSSRRQGAGLFTAHRADQRVQTHDYSTGLEAVEYCGMGTMLMRTDVVADLARPWFRHGLNEHGGDIGEDVGFCRALRAAGHTIYIDHDLSKEIGHIGQHTYRTLQHEAVTV
jgi:hypothetical protein